MLVQVSLKAVVSLYNPQRYILTPTLIPFDRNSDTPAGLKNKRNLHFILENFSYVPFFIY